MWWGLGRSSRGELGFVPVVFGRLVVGGFGPMWKELDDEWSAGGLVGVVRRLVGEYI